MAKPDVSIAAQAEKDRILSFWREPLLGMGVGVLGGALQSDLLTTSLAHGIVNGALFGVAFGFFFSRRASSPGAGLIWGVATALLLWMVVPAGILLAASLGSIYGYAERCPGEFPSTRRLPHLFGYASRGHAGNLGQFSFQNEPA